MNPRLVAVCPMDGSRVRIIERWWTSRLSDPWLALQTFAGLVPEGDYRYGSVEAVAAWALLQRIWA